MSDSDIALAIALSLHDRRTDVSQPKRTPEKRNSVDLDQDMALALSLSINEQEPAESASASMIHQPILDDNPTHCSICHKFCRVFVTVNGQRYHPECFCCAACNEQLCGQYIVGQDHLFYHQRCSIELFSPRCCLCSDPLTTQYYRHKFFENEKYCSQHQFAQRSCFSCDRKEPTAKSRKEKFSELPDKRLICQDCVTTIILDSDEAAPLYQEAVDFMEFGMGMRIPEGMREVPVLAVDLLSLNEQRPHGQQSHAGVTTGLTLSSQSSVRHMAPGSIRWDPVTGFITVTEATVLRVQQTRAVTAVLVLVGLPRDLTTAILAHEAMHVWMSLTTSMPFQLPPTVSEGLCQVMSHRFLSTAASSASSSPRGAMHSISSSSSPSSLSSGSSVDNQSLREYFKYKIQEDTSAVYGAGFRQADKCCAELGLAVVLELVEQTQSLPNL